MTAGLPALLALAGCSLAPAYHRPDPAIPPSWSAGAPDLRADEAALPAVSYREIFRDPHLLAIIGQALANNQDLRVALANVAAARAQSRVAQAQILPQLDVTAGADVRHGEAGGASNNLPGKSYALDGGLSGFEVDLFGRLSNLSTAAFNEYLGTEAALRSARLTLVAQVAVTYLTLAADRSLLAIAVDTEDSATRSVELTRVRLAGGLAPRTDLRQAETILSQAQSDKAQLTTQVAQDRAALDLLVGAPVADADLPAAIETVEGLRAAIPAGLDSRILLRRPDVLQAEYALRAANARIGAARAAFFPTISLTAVAGLASTALSALFTGGAFNWQVAPQATLPIFDGGANRGNLAFAKAERDAATAKYQKAIQTAFSDVATALARRATIDDQLAADTRLEAAAADTLTLATARYQRGIDTYLDLLDAQRTLYQARRTVANTRLVRATNLVAVYRALGGDQLVDTLPPPTGNGG
ncbi:efflux transporter outer membrane subunit [Rhizorhabdus wittichii]|uniref:Efflux transporter outer membrane subunit n=1 Tax=Rhizorhabdus wittichii TaxID=160791 RepID=A0A975D403_9SPHN|nr:efflux transporter outer membrane subunit [Rhizorhabdus wittichii]QTH22487.1 efflux transporter outer membrane subunit [Rhizorhabdus wittichii]